MRNQSIDVIIEQIKKIDNSFWQLSAVIEVCVDLYELTGDKTYLDSALDIVGYLWGSCSRWGAYGGAKIGFQNPFNDDLLWWCMSALRYSKYAPTAFMGDGRLDIRRRLLDDVRFHFDLIDRRGNTGRGVLWNGDWLTMHTDRACCSNFSYCIVAHALGEYAKAEQAWEWATAHLLHDGRLSDKLDATDRIEDEATYNYGLLLLAAKQLGKPLPKIAPKEPLTVLYMRKEQHEYNLEFAPIILLRGLRAWGIDTSEWAAITPRKTIYTDLLTHYILETIRRTSPNAYPFP